MNRTLLTQAWLLSGIILANFVAQIFYFIHLYYTPQNPLPNLQSTLALGSVFVLFLAGVVLLLLKPYMGYIVLSIFLALEFFFYLWNIIGGMLHGYGMFFHLAEPDPTLWVVFAIGYLNFFASGYFLFLLLYKRREFITTNA
jgi:hypothetical protein